ncbi:MAG: hypothetical protein ACXADS_13995 [Candidatus Thorarchaeota archaeon]|jgi:hypothetical protein
MSLEEEVVAGSYCAYAQLESLAKLYPSLSFTRIDLDPITRLDDLGWV